MPRIHIVHLVESNDRHGWLESLIDSLDKDGFSQSVLTLTPPNRLKEFYEVNYPHIKVYGIKRDKFFVFRALLELKRITKNTSINVLFSLGHPASFLGGTARTVLGLHLVICHMQQPRFFEFLKPKWKGFLHGLLYKSYSKRADLNIALSKEVYEKLKELRIPERRIIQLSIGLDFEKIRKELNHYVGKSVKVSGKPKILMVGRLSREKNYQLALRVLKNLTRDYPEARLVIAGKGPLESELKMLVNSYGLSENVQFIGYVENIPALMSNFEVLLHLATTEGYGQVYLEALLCGLSVVSTRVGVAIDFSEAGISDVYVVSNDSELAIVSGIISSIEYRESHLNNRANYFEQLAHHDSAYVQKKYAEIIKKHFENSDLRR